MAGLEITPCSTSKNDLARIGECNEPDLVAGLSIPFPLTSAQTAQDVELEAVGKMRVGVDVPSISRAESRWVNLWCGLCRAEAGLARYGLVELERHEQVKLGANVVGAR